MDQGTDARLRGDHIAELRAFQSADAIMHVPTTSLEVGKAFTALGKWIEAHDAFLRAADAPVVPGEFPAQKDARKTASDTARELDRKIPRVSIRLAGPLAAPADPVVELDQLTMAVSDIATPTRVNPGAHTVRATLSDGRSASATFTAVEGSTVDVSLALRDSEAKAPIASRDDTTWKVVTYSGAGLFVLGTAIGTVTGIVSLGKTNTLKDACNGKLCPESVQGELDSARTFASISTVSFVGAGIGALAAALGYFVLRPEVTRGGAASSVWIAPSGVGARF